MDWRPGRAAVARFRSAFDDAPIGMALVDLGPAGEGRILVANRALGELLGRPAEALRGVAFGSLLHPSDAEQDAALMDDLLAGRIPRYELETRFRAPDERLGWMLVTVALARDAKARPGHAIRQVQDITERKHVEGELRHLADHDPLTGLFNRRRFETELARQVAYARRYGGALAVLMLDLDNFKRLNDTFGHSAGDELLVHVAHQLRDRLRATDVLARLGGDEFAIVLPDTDRRAAVHLADELLEAVRGGISTAARGVAISVSIGIAPAAEGSPADAGDLLIDADLALAEAKAAGRDRVAVTGAGAQRMARHPKLTWSGIIRRALADDRFVVCRQPILHLATRRTTQHELLLRLLADDGQLILPGAFLHTAERFGLARAVDRWVIGQAVELLGAHAGTRLEINLSAGSMTDPDLPAYIEGEVARAAVDPAGLIFEVTETAAIANIDEARSFVLRIAELGCSFALDDFGAGFGSFYYLKYLPTAFLKIDGEFIRDLPHSAIDQHLVRSVVAIARGLGKRTIAEHVGDEATLRLLAEYGVDYAQGYHVGTPILTSEAWPASPPAGVAATP